jgi:hypothetical protein
MSEGEQSHGPSSGTWLGLGVIGIFLAGGCLVACLGLVGLGFALPAVQKAKQAARAQAEAHEAARQAAEAQAPAERSADRMSDDAPPKEEAGQPEQAETQPTDEDRAEEQ